MRANFRADLLMTGLVGLTTTLVVAFALGGCTQPGKERKSVAGSVLASGSKAGAADAKKTLGADDEVLGDDVKGDETDTEAGSKTPPKTTTPPSGGDGEEPAGDGADGDDKDADKGEPTAPVDDKDSGGDDDSKDDKDGAPSGSLPSKVVSGGQTWQLLDAKMTWFEASGLVRTTSGSVQSETQVMIPCSTLHGAVYANPSLRVDVLGAVQVSASFGNHGVAYDCRGYPQGLIPVAANVAAQILRLPFAVLGSAFGILTGVRTTTPYYYGRESSVPAQPVPASFVGMGCAKLGAAWRLPSLDEVSDAHEAGISTKLAAAAGKTVWTATATSSAQTSDAVTVALSTGVSRPVAMTGRQYVLCVKDN